MDRVVQPEWLDELPPTELRAVQSRKDLRLINVLMGNASAVARCLLRNTKNGRSHHLVEVGAGDGTFALSLARRLCRTVSLKEVTLVDQAALADGYVRGEFEKLGCPLNVVQADIFTWFANAAKADVIVANLFLHHFDREPLQRLLRSIATHAQMFIACEPRRSSLGLAASRLLGLLGCNDVTRHDAVISVRAGFSGDELSGLWPDRVGWNMVEQRSGLFSHLFVARRNDLL